MTRNVNAQSALIRKVMRVGDPNARRNMTNGLGDRTGKKATRLKNERASRRQADYRRRFARGEGVALMPFDTTILDTLIRLGYLAASDAGDRRKVGEAAARALFGKPRGSPARYFDLACEASGPA